MRTVCKNQRSLPLSPIILSEQLNLHRPVHYHYPQQVGRDGAAPILANVSSVKLGRDFEVALSATHCTMGAKE